MPNPKRRHSQKRTATRRAHDSLSITLAVGVSELPRTEDATPRLPEVRNLQGAAKVIEVAEKS